MNNLKIVRGTDVLLMIDNDILFGMTEFHSEEKLKYHNVYEYLNGKPLARLPESTAYTIRLSVMTLFSHQIPSDRSFTLCVRYDEKEYAYEECRVAAVKSEIKGAAGGSQVFTIEAQRMLERVIDDE